MTADKIDHAAEALRTLGLIKGVDEQTNQITLALDAQVHATLALAAEVAALRESFGQCDHGHTICP